jgi:predicted P-loop ATPase/GTPase
MSATFGSLLNTGVVAVSTTLFAGILLFKYREYKRANRLRTALKQEIGLNNEQKVKEGHIRTGKN